MQSPSGSSPGTWQRLQPGLQRRVAPPGPWFQFHDAVGFEWNIYRVLVDDLPPPLEGFRIVQLSDLHCQPHWQSAYDDLLDRLHADEPDLIVLTGDIVDDIIHPEKCLPTARRFLQQLRARHGVLAIMGNHDFFTDPADYHGTPVRFIDGRQLWINHGGAVIELIAVPGPERLDCPRDFGQNFSPRRHGVPRVMLSHFPDHIRRLRFLKPDIYLSGHTHGGQICLPGRVPIIRHDSLGMKFFHGAHRLGDAWFFVSRGFGFSTAAYRIFCPAEVIEIQLSSRD